MPPVPSLLSETDYEAIEAAVMETARGRWFMAEYARRNRRSDTTTVLAAIERLDHLIRTEATMPSADRIRGNLVDMAQSIAKAKAEIAAVKPANGGIEEAAGELDSIVRATETAASDIL